MTLPAQDIVERVRAHRQAFGVHYEQREVEVCIEAADTISRLTADNEALRKHVAFLRDALGKERKSVWRDVKLSASTEEAVDAVLEWSADSARADALAQEVERLRLPEGTLAKHGSTITIEFDNAEYALRAFDAIEYAMSREPVALANEEAGE